jgi:hypothetical protein
MTSKILTTSPHGHMGIFVCSTSFEHGHQIEVQ